MSYKTIQQLRKETEQYSIAGISAITIYREIKNDPAARKRFKQQLESALERLFNENPQIGRQIPIYMEKEIPKQISVQSQ